MFLFLKSIIMYGVLLDPKETNIFLKKYSDKIDEQYKLGKLESKILVPIKKETISYFKDKYDVIEYSFEKKEKLKINKSFDIIGELIIFNFQKPSNREIEILKKMYPFLKAILVKRDKINNVYRFPEYEIVYGNNTETIYRENGIILKLDPTKVYFSPRLSNERKRILEQVKNGEKIFIPFAGIGPYSILFKKNKLKCEIHSVEINPIAYKYFLENIKLNRINKDDFFVYLGDAREFVKNYDSSYFDRILSPLPRYSHDFLYAFWPKLKKGGIYHYYRLATSVENVIQELDERLGKEKYVVNEIKITGSSSPKEKRYCFDLIKKE